jgi:hypothetical protein
MIKIDKGIDGPQSFVDLLAADDLTCLIEEDGQNRKRLLLQFDLQPVLMELARAQIGFVDPEANDGGRFREVVDGGPAPSASLPQRPRAAGEVASGGLRAATQSNRSVCQVTEGGGAEEPPRIDLPSRRLQTRSCSS